MTALEELTALVPPPADPRPSWPRLTWADTIVPRHDYGSPHLQRCFTEVLLGWVRGEIDVAGLPADDEDETEPHAFYPATYRMTSG
jgi:hypothetical protein